MYFKIKYSVFIILFSKACVYSFNVVCIGYNLLNKKIRNMVVFIPLGTFSKWHI